ncbi:MULTISPECIES: type 3 dihydrofolate reductase [Aeromonas]|jgi:dihydrofolate reductase|uniref:Dihydrofolate reductase n=1 Tax=Aeromonas veronii TaxID=654 RepID=A0A2T4N0U9_AERVE|nr:type 3 dihydrofolate reductase [Aeromonas veronii]AXV22131.1 type 3 dihydrofolate reductase [Aeromonas veronii]MBA2797781.1 type 3 dihydrofolate reductase [Aeromonas veronii]MBL0477250.1 type 3 dihydrofolate reductase [Aeromonas veronii]MCX0442450.1 type 3 dihydrofolate reductase [Aeromonas veronii]PTH80475.1 type 3 dihydrofolate reductase [Aeromonas veronii]
MKISMIAAMAHDRVIGKDNQMPWHLPADLAHFKRVTLGKPVLMGRKTFESIGRPLPGRRNLVISRNPDYQAEGIEVVGSVEAALALLAGSSVEELMVIGGGHLYAEMLPSADCLYLTQIDLAVEGDTRFPAFDDAHWQRVDCESHPADEKNPHPYSFETWQRR